MIVPEYNQCLVQWLGNWDENAQYDNVQILSQPGVYFTLSVVSYANIAYVMNNTSTPIRGTIPPEDSAWSIWTASGSSSEHYKGTYDASTNTPTLEDGIGEAGDFYLVIVGGSNNPTGEDISAGSAIVYNGATWQDGGAVNNTDQIVVSSDYVSIPNKTVAIGQTTTYALGALQGQATLAATNITTNTTNIATNTSDIADLTLQVDTNTTNIEYLNNNKQNLIASATNNHIATTDAAGQTKDSGVAISNVQLLIATPTDNNVATMDSTGQTKNSNVSIATTITNTDSTVPTSKAVETYVSTAITPLVTNPMTTLGDLITGGASGAPTRLAGNTTTTPKYLKSLGDGANATAETWTQIDYADIAGTPAVGSVVYNPLTNYVPTNFVTYNGYIWECIANTVGNAPSTSSTVWRQASNVNYNKFATVNIFVGNDTTGNGSYPFETCQAALNYVGNGGGVSIYGFEQVYNENLNITGQNQFLGAFGAVQEIGAYHRSLTIASGGSHFSCSNVGYINPVDSPCLNVVTGSNGYCNFYNNNFTISAATPVSPAIEFSGTWAGDYYFDSCNISQPITIAGTPVAPYKIFITNCYSYNNIISINLNCNVELHINNCKQVNILSHTAGKIFIDNVPYISTLDVSASASANNKLTITNSSMRNPATGTYAIPTGTGTIACEFLNFDYNRGAYSFAGAIVDSDNGFNAINRLAWISGYNYILADIVTYGSSLWRCIKPTGTTTQTPAVGATDWELISAYNQEKIAYVDTTMPANYSNVYTTLQAASNAAGQDGTVIILTPNSFTSESVVVTHDHQSWLVVGSVQGGANFTLLGIADTTPLTLDNVEGFKCEGLEISSIGAAYAISMDNVTGGIFFDKCNINYSDTPDLMVIGGTWDGLIQFNNCKIDGFINSTLGTSPATSQIIINNCRPGDSNDLIIGLDSASLATLYGFDCPTLRVFHSAGKVYLANIPLVGNSNFDAPTDANNLLSINTCSFYNTTTQTYSTISGIGDCDTILQNVNYDRGAYTFAGLIPDGDTIAGIPVTSLSATAIFANMQGFTGSALSPAGYLNLNNGTTTFNNITVGTTAVTFLAQARIYKVTAVIEVISNNPEGSSSSLTLTPTVAGTGITINMLAQSISDSSNGVTHTLFFNGTINVSNTVSTTTFSLVLTSLTGGYSFGATNSMVIQGIN